MNVFGALIVTGFVTVFIVVVLFSILIEFILVVIKRIVKFLFVLDVTVVFVVRVGYLIVAITVGALEERYVFVRVILVGMIGSLADEILALVEVVTGFSVITKLIYYVVKSLARTVGIRNPVVCISICEGTLRIGYRASVCAVGVIVVMSLDICLCVMSSGN